MVEPRAQDFPAITRGIGCDKNQFDLIPQIRRHLLKGCTYIRHVERTNIRTVSVSEKKERDVSIGLRSEIKSFAGCGAESKARLWQGRRDQATPVRGAGALLRRRQRRENEE